MESKIFGIDQDAFSVPHNLNQALNQLRSSNYHIHNNCRFEIYKKYYLNNYVNAIRDIHDNQTILFENEILLGYKDYWELLYLARSKSILNCSDSSIRKEIENIFQGSIIEQSISTPWDYQFQYLLSSIFERSGINVMLKEPDFQFIYKGKKYSVAAKRLNGKNSVGRNIKEAEKQISKTDNYGFIALSLDKIYKSHNEIMTFNDPDYSIRIANEMIEQIIRSYIRGSYFADRSDQILGIIAHIAFPFKYKSRKPIYELGYSAFTMFLPLALPDSAEWNEVIEISERIHRIDIKTLL